jgi:hypothetical protein
MSKPSQPDPQASAETSPELEASEELSAEELDKVAGGVIAPVIVVAANPVLVNTQVPSVGGLPQIPGKGGLVL